MENELEILESKIDKIISLMERTTSINEKEICLQKLEELNISIKDKQERRKVRIQMLRNLFKDMFYFELQDDLIPIRLSYYFDILKEYKDRILNEFSKHTGLCKKVYNKFKLFEDTIDEMKCGILSDILSYKYIFITKEEMRSLITRSYLYFYFKDENEMDDETFYTKKEKELKKGFINTMYGFNSDIDNGYYDNLIKEYFEEQKKKETIINNNEDAEKYANTIGNIIKFKQKKK